MATDQKEHLIALLRHHPEEQVRHLLEYAEFLLERYGLPEEIPQPEAIPRPEKETVIEAIKRLCASYPMLDRRMLFNETSVLMAQHTMGGRDTVEVIDELEALFRRHYQVLVEPKKDIGSK